MRTCHRTLLSVVTICFVALGVTPASGFYNPNTGKWLNRDSIGEQGGLNVSAAFHNSSVNYFDRLGQDCPNLLLTKVPPTTTTLKTKEECSQKCGNNLNLDGSVAGAKPACTKHQIDPTTKCRCCPNKEWRIEVTIKSQCRFFFADAKLGGDIDGDPKAHEDCHCKDGETALETIIGEIAAIGAFSSKADCEKRRALIDVDKRFDELMEPSVNHRGSRWERGGACYAQGNIP